jgi:hypothetical protein
MAGYNWERGKRGPRGQGRDEMDGYNHKAIKEAEAEWKAWVNRPRTTAELIDDANHAVAVLDTAVARESMSPANHAAQLSAARAEVARLEAVAIDELVSEWTRDKTIAVREQFNSAARSGRYTSRAQIGRELGIDSEALVRAIKHYNL